MRAFLKGSSSKLSPNSAKPVKSITHQYNTPLDHYFKAPGYIGWYFINKGEISCDQGFQPEGKNG
jgi:hypothetical protein